LSFEIPDYTAQVDGIGALWFLDAIREVGLRKSSSTKLLQVSCLVKYWKFHRAKRVHFIRALLMVLQSFMVIV